MTEESRKSYHHGDLRKALVKAGREILETQGRQALTLRACAKEAGVSHAAPQHHFANASVLLSEIAASGFVDFVAELDEAAGAVSTPPERVIAMGLRYFKFAQEHPALYKIMFAGDEALEWHDSLKTAKHAAWVQLSDAVSQVVDCKAPVHGAMLVWSIVHGFSMLASTQAVPPSVTLQESLRPMLESAVAGLLSSGA